MSPVQVVNSSDHFKSLLSEDLTRVSLINFWASWAEPCKEMNKLVNELSDKYPQALVLQVCYSCIWSNFMRSDLWISGRS